MVLQEVLAAPSHAQLVDAMPLVVHLDALHSSLGHASQRWLEIRAAGCHLSPLWLLFDFDGHRKVRAVTSCSCRCLRALV
jgi:hypothetical protein